MFKTRAVSNRSFCGKNLKELLRSDENCDRGFDKFRRKSAKTRFNHTTNTFTMLLREMRIGGLFSG